MANPLHRAPSGSVARPPTAPTKPLTSVQDWEAWFAALSPEEQQAFDHTAEHDLRVARDEEAQGVARLVAENVAVLVAHLVADGAVDDLEAIRRALSVGGLDEAIEIARRRRGG